MDKIKNPPRRVTISDELYDEVRLLAGDTGKSIKSVTEDALLNYIYLVRKHLNEREGSSK